MKLVLSCEHAGNEIPIPYQHLFIGAEDALNSHRGFDPGAFDLFSELKPLAHFSHFQKTSRLLVEMNRSLHHKNLFSVYTKELPTGKKREILEEYYFPYRDVVENKVAELIEKGGKVVHLSVHSFSPELNGTVRDADIGLLYDPSRKAEKELCVALKQQLLKKFPELKVRSNYPYLGKADGFTTYLRKKFPENYAGIELEVNQKFTTGNKMQVFIKNDVFQALRCILD